jgi:hypothetical protein
MAPWHVPELKPDRYLPTCSSALRIGALEICINPL